MEVHSENAARRIGNERSREKSCIADVPSSSFSPYHAPAASVVCVRMSWNSVDL